MALPGAVRGRRDPGDRRRQCARPGAQRTVVVVWRWDRRLQRRTSACSSHRPGGAGRARRLYRPRGQSKPHRHPDLGSQGRHRGRRLVRLFWSGRHHCGVRAWCGRSSAARLRYRRPRAGRRRARGGTAGGGRPGPKIHVDPLLS
jgi:hypothetical protein